jgi:lipopolysaccharide export system protein LptC
VGDLNFTSTMSQPPARELRQIGRRDLDRMLRAAARHSRLVRFLRVAIPAAIIAVAAGLVVVTFFNPFKLIGSFPIDPGKVSLSGTKIVMESPRLNGFTGDGRPYELTAQSAVQDVTKPDLLELNNLSAHVQQTDSERIDIQSVNGLYDTKAEVLQLRDHIVLTTTSGYVAYLSEATAKIATGNIVSDSPVTVKLPNGVLTSKRLEVIDNGALLRFTGDVELNIDGETVTSSISAAPSNTASPSAASRQPTQTSVARRPVTP